MENFIFPLKLLLAFVLGAVIGLEREINEKRSGDPKRKPVAVLGLRSFSLITGMGALCGEIYTKNPTIALLLAIPILVLFITFYIIDTLFSKDTGITTEIALLYSFMIGLLLALNIVPIQLTIAITVILVLLLSRKEHIKDVVEDIKKREINAVISYFIIALVILPFLPNTSFALADIPGSQEFFSNIGVQLGKIAELDILNPFKLWLIVALITGVDLVGYILERTIGQKKGWLLTSIAGGFVSSTATTQSLAQQSKQAKQVNHLLAAAVVANLTSFLQIAFLIAAFNALLFVKILPTILLLLFSSSIVAFYFLRVKEKDGKAVKRRKGQTEIFNLVPALKFAGLYVVISIISKVALELFGNSGFLVATGIGALAGLDAVMINTAQLAGQRVDFTVAVIAFLLANAVNLLGKVAYSFLQGSKEFSVKFLLAMLVIILASFVGLLFV